MKYFPQNDEIFLPRLWNISGSPGSTVEGVTGGTASLPCNTRSSPSSSSFQVWEWWWLWRWHSQLTSEGELSDPGDVVQGWKSWPLLQVNFTITNIINITIMFIIIILILKWGWWWPLTLSNSMLCVNKLSLEKGWLWFQILPITTFHLSLVAQVLHFAS